MPSGDFPRLITAVSHRLSFTLVNMDTSYYPRSKNANKTTNQANMKTRIHVLTSSRDMPSTYNDSINLIT